MASGYRPATYPRSIQSAGYRGLPEDQVSAVSSQGVQSYALATGWTRVEGGPVHLAVFHHPCSDLDQVIVPLNSSAPDYARRIAEAVDTLAARENRPPWEVLENLLQTGSDPSVHRIHATVSHFEIPARDMERAVRFYREVFGWSIEPLAWEGHPYYKVRGSAVPKKGEREGIDGGITQSGHGVEQPLLMIHLSGIGLQDCLRKIEEAGGTIEMPATAVSGMGSWARFRDLEGNLLGLWQA